ncbi:C3H1-type domain-containing protein, partial [Psidium guajava]
MNGWDSHAMLEHYIYEYMIKKQMHETAEIFKREAALNFETALPGGNFFLL